MPSREDFGAAVAAHDADLRRLGVDLWVGSEPTFTDRWSTAPEWTNEALGEDKVQRALALVRSVHRATPGAVILRTIGRQYPGEERARWSYGLYRRRDGRAIWEGPPDPLTLSDPIPREPCLKALRAALRSALAEDGLGVWDVPDTTKGEWRLVFRLGGDIEPEQDDPRLLRPSIHAVPVPASGLCDELAREGLFLLIIATEVVETGTVARIELPGIGDVPTFLRLLAAIGRAAAGLRLPGLILAGFPPPSDASVEWMTITPDPAVIEINSAPDRSAAAFLERSRAIYAAAREQQLTPYRLYFNGTVGDSGGGGQITLGGPSPGASPFFVDYALLPRLIRYVQRHPSLSYLFAHDFVGGSGQSVRVDERGDDAFRELRLGLALLARDAEPTPEILWRSLAPFLTDGVGNSHRAELNIEKLWNPFLPGRGQLGLVEFRAFRMQHTPERATALVCLLRAVVAMLMNSDPAVDLRSWGDALHDRYALPFCLEDDLLVVLRDLAAAGLAVGQSIVAALFQDEFREQAELSFQGVSLRLRRALEFWPLLGDAGSQEAGTSRLVDSSTHRLEVMLQSESETEHSFSAWGLQVEGIELPFQFTEREGRPVKVFGVRYRSFVPWQGLHPTLGARDKLRLVLHHPACEEACEVTWHEWRPVQGPYPGLPEDLDEARARRAERLVSRPSPRVALRPAVAAPDGSLTPWCLDLRWLAG
ncbi:hypothetical protein EWI61_13060 [Methylolobus aquaticus]|nr:hypothetical protein EWI61_13060 [Methylolobus aquaticus]